ncbi:sigma factor-like helix-turn-helix DNA-binding protein [Paractinoplanes globisporus]|uniref:Sigma factor-like helix-turn-helix DNA-binding protein n=1 Tax=Paractinoplanes globisporus TaxID=113565 RepID=A0ABW6WCR6_9ACTN|nr:sigma factor-like helix-turn-helix DNA-binding protein [Actinoplanes globisporus]
MSRRGRTDEVLVRRVFEEHGAALLAYASRLVGDRARGEAVAQEALLAAWRDPELLEGPARAHLFAIVRAAAGTGPEPDLALLGAVETLSPEHRDVLRALYFQGRDVAEASESLGVPAGAVKARSYHALRRLREAVAG